MNPTPRSAVLLLWLGLGLSGASQAQYKVIGADGKVTYTDRPPSATDGKVVALGARSAPAVDALLPLELRQPASRYPVTLYVTGADCDPCNSARQLLRQRGIPFAEKQVLNGEDAEALERLSGGRDAPTLSVGAQLLRGLAPDVWGSYLDAAGYPRESRLPASYQYAAATPVTERRDAAPRSALASSRSASATAADAGRPVPAAPPGSIKF